MTTPIPVPVVGTPPSITNWGIPITERVNELTETISVRRAAVVTRVSPYTVSVSGAVDPVQWTVEETDYGDMVDLAANNTRVTITADGVYSLVGYLSYAINATGYRVARIDRNGARVFEQKIPAISGTQADVTVAGTMLLATGDYLQLIAYQTSGGSLTASPVRLAVVRVA